MEVRIKLAELLEKKNMSQRELSRLTGIRLASINEMYNNDTSRLPLGNLAKICEALSCKIQDILKLEN
ncbi:MAG TPA: XRE family transcriptional regulator [Candidatus Veblenbacteria bacterium]|nr:XRE family transcriptional regulator [Candidatus Veblenbacteria bacterium]